MPDAEANSRKSAAQHKKKNQINYFICCFDQKSKFILERISKWSDTKVSRIEAKGQKMIESAMLTRSDGLKINLFPNS